MSCVNLKVSKLKTDKTKEVEEKRKEIAEHLRRKRDIAVFISRDKTTESQRIAFTNTYSEHEKSITRLEIEIRKLQTQHTIKGF